jgi:hypothetical protein
MSMLVQREQVWVASIEDRPGGLCDKLSALARADANLLFVIARRSDDQPGKGVVFVTPITGDAQKNAAAIAGFHPSTSLHAIRAQGPDRVGLGVAITQTIADADLNVRGLSAASIDGQCIVHMAMDTEADAARAAKLLKHLR